jgi:hypothetical protein
MTRVMGMETARIASLKDVRLLDLPLISGDRSWLVVLEDQGLGLDLRRFFAVGATEAVQRGNHAHKACTQVLFSLIGRITVTCDDSESRQDFILDGPRQALVIPPSIWASQHYAEGAILGVLCDRVYEAEDYLRDYQAFVSYRAGLTLQKEAPIPHRSRQ